MLSMEETVKICKESMDTGKELHEIIKKFEPNVKVIRFVQEGDEN